MAGRNGTGIAKALLLGLAFLLVAGIAGSFYLGARARSAAEQDVIDQARDIAGQSLTLVFKPEDLTAPVGDARAADLTTHVSQVVMDPSTFDGVTLWSADGQILYSTDVGRIGNTLDGEREVLRQVLRGEVSTSISDGVVSVMLPFQLKSGVGSPAVVELTTSAAAITAAPGPWRTNAIFLALLLAVVVVVLYRITRPPSVPYALQYVAPPRQPAPQPLPSATAATPLPVSRPISVPSPGLREQADARKKAEDRARAAEERLSVLQDQYRNTLEELQETQRRVRDQAAAASRPDPALQERLVRAEQRARDQESHSIEVEAKLRTLSAEHEELVRLIPDPAVLSKANDQMAELVTQRDALKKERDALIAERDELSSQRADLATQLASGAPIHEDPELRQRVQHAETETIGLRAELDGSQTQLSMARRELETLRQQAERADDLAERARVIQEDLDAAHVEALHARESSETAQAELFGAKTELEDARNELRIMRNEEQRAAMLEDELRAARAEVESLAASHSAELVEREMDLEDKVRAAREEFQEQVAAMAAQQEDLRSAAEADAKEHLATVQRDAANQMDALRAELADRDERYGSAEDEVAAAKAEAQRLDDALAAARTELDAATAGLTERTAHVEELTERVARAERESVEAAQGSAKVSAALQDATQGNADLNRRLQEIEARRALEIANAEGRADLDELLRVTQERLAGQTEKLIAAEDHLHQLEREMRGKAERIDEVEAKLRQQQMSEAMRQLRPEDAPAGSVGEPALMSEDRRATSPFMKELSLDAKRSLTQIMGLTQILKHKKDAKEQAQLVRQLTAYARRLDHLVADMMDADTLVHGDIALNRKRSDLEALVQRVVEESGVGADHEVRVEAERVMAAVDPVRTEQILAGLLRNSGDRTPAKKAITIQLQASSGGALISVSDPEPSSDASLSPVVERFAQVQDGWAKVESNPDGGSVFRVFLPDGPRAPEDQLAGPEIPAAEEPVTQVDDVGSRPDAEAPSDLHIVVEEEAPEPSDGWTPSEEQLLVQELHRLSELTAED